MSAAAPPSPLWRLQGLGQNIWLEFPGRAVVRSGQLARLIAADRIAGVAFNPRIVENVLTTSSDYDRSIAEFARRGLNPEAISTALAVADMQEAADLLRPLFEATDGAQGFASLAVSPHAVDDTEEMIERGRALWSMLARPNAMIAVPATVAGVAAIRELVAEGINVHVTQLYGVTRYRHIALAYVEGLRMREQGGRSVARVASVANFLLSPIDQMLDPRVEAMAALGSAKAARLVNQIAISSAKIVYRRWRDIFEADPFAILAGAGARPQKLLWTAGSAAGDAHSDTRYSEALIGNGTAMTMTFEAIMAYRKDGRSGQTLEEGVQEAQAALANLASLGLDVGAVALQLESEGIGKLTAAYDSLTAAIARKLAPAERHVVDAASLTGAR